MTTASWSTTIDNSTDALFRAWGSELSAKFAAVGMVQTADTGQINWTTAVRGAINTAAGYEIWRLSSSNLYFKIEYGSGSVVNTVPSLWLTVGTGSNGSGTLTGQLSTRQQVGKTTTTISSTVTNYQSYLCATANYFGLSWKIGSVSSTAGEPRAFMAVMQTIDNTGAASAVGYFVGVSTSAAALTQQCVATTAAVTGTALASNNFCIVPNNATNPPASSADGAGNNQAFLWWFSILGTTPMIPLLHCAMVLLTDLAVGTTASMTLVGSTPHTYISAGNNIMGDGAAVISNTNTSVVMLFE